MGNKDNKLVAYALFAGAGGLKLGLERAGFEVAVSTDVSTHAEQTHALNWPRSTFIKSDIRLLSATQLLKAAGGRPPDLLIGGPPCQGFSTLGDKLSADPRNDLFSPYLRLARELKPQAILIENVKSITTMYGGRFSKWITEELEKLGFGVSLSVLDASRYGVPQVRHRAFFIGLASGLKFVFPEPTHGEGTRRKAKTVGQALKGLEDLDESVPNHIPLKHSERVIARYKLIPEGGRLPPPEELPPEIRRKNFGNTYKRLHRDRPSLTLVPGNNAFPIHPVSHRSLTPREAARLQGFPDSFIFSGDRRNQCILVGNAVPPKLAEVIGKSIKTQYSFGSAPGQSRPKIRKTTDKMGSKAPSLVYLQEPSRDGFVDLFCGAGGFTIGLAKAGFQPLLGVDLNPNVASTHRQNYPGIPFIEGDVSDPTIQQNISEVVSKKNLALVVGGPPCQGFSVFGKRRFVNTRNYDPHSDDRNKLVFSFIEQVIALQPRWFIMENVAGLSTLDGGEFLKAIIHEFRRGGYSSVEAKILNAADYGVPQLRKRLVIIGNRTGHILPWPKKKFFSEPEDWQRPHRTVGEAISDLADEQAYGTQTCHVPMKHKPLLVERYKYIPEGGRLDVEALPEHLRKGYRTKKVKNYSHVFKRLDRAKPSITMVPGHNAFPIHPWLNRALTVREAARIQTFSDEVEFCGSRQEQCIQVGNAFPPLLAEIIANNIAKAETNDWYPGDVPASAYYALVEGEKDEAQSTGQLEIFKLNTAAVG